MTRPALVMMTMTALAFPCAPIVPAIGVTKKHRADLRMSFFARKARPR